MSTSSPGPHSESIACIIDCLAPLEHTICSGAYSIFFSVLRYRQIASRSARDPAFSVYLTRPWVSASCAASITGAAGTKSGSPTEREMTCFPSRRSAAARSVT